jgi:hypothetical protein
MSRILKSVLIVAAVMFVLVPVAIGVTLYMMPLWVWIELNYQIESVGHSGPAEWCYRATYALLATVILATMALLTATRPKRKVTSE